MTGDQLAAALGVGAAPLQRAGVGLGDSRGDLRLVFHAGHQRDTGLRDACFALQQTAPFLLQVDAAIQVRRDQPQGTLAGLAQCHGDGRLGEQGVVGTAHQQQLHGVDGGGDVTQAQVLAHIDAGTLGQQAEEDVRHVATERHGDFLAAQVVEGAQALFARHQPEQTPGRNVEHAQLCAAVVEVGGDVDRHGQHVRLLIQRQQAQLVGIAPADEFHLVRQVVQRTGFDHVDQRVRYRRGWAGQDQARQLVRQRWRSSRQQNGH